MTETDILLILMAVMGIALVGMTCWVFYLSDKEVQLLRKAVQENRKARKKLEKLINDG